MKKIITTLTFFIAFSSFNLFGKEPLKNLLLITIDTIRPDRISSYSSKYLITPNIDKIAKNGAIFKRAFAHNPTTLPSHVNILLGVLPIYHGVHDNSHFRLNESFVTIAEYLKNFGFSTGAFIGAFPLDSRFGLSQGFDIYDDSYPSKAKREYLYPERKAEKVISSAISWVSKRKEPWFAWVHLFDPHQPYIPPEPFFTRFKDDLYSGEVAYVDKEIGKLMDFIEKSGKLGNTFIVLTGDHGESLGEHGESTHGYFAYNSTLWIPLIFYGAGISRVVVEDYVSHIDIFPTICDLLKLNKPSHLQGSSLLPLIKGKKIKDRAIYFESLHPFYNRGWAPLRGVIFRGKKYIDLPITELYDIEKDFNEKTNIISEKEIGFYKDILNDIEMKMGNPQKKESMQKIDKDTLEKLESLGYISSPYPYRTKKFSPEDDLKTLLPVHQKFTEAMLLYQRKRMGDAIELFKAIIQEKKGFDLAYCRLAEIYKDIGMLKEAMETMKEGYRNNPENHFIISTYGILLAEAGNPDEAIKILSKGIQLYDFDPELWNYLGISYWRKGENQKALDCYRKALLRDENYAIVYNNIGSLYLSVYMKEKNSMAIDQSIENFKKAIDIDPEIASAYNGLGGAYKAKGEIDLAIKNWRKSLDLNPDYEFPIYNLGIAYLEKGEKKKALEYLNRYLNIKKNISLQEKIKIESLIKKCQEQEF